MTVSGSIQFDGIIDGKDGAPGAAGANSVRIDLSNQADLISCDANGKVRFARTITTIARIYDGASVAPSVTSVSDITLNVTRIVNGTPTTVNVVTKRTYARGVRFSFDFKAGDVLADTSYTLSIAITYNGKSYSADFTLSRTDSAAIYQLLPSKSEIIFSVDNSNNYTPAEASMYCGYIKESGSGVTSYEGTTRANTFKGTDKYTPDPDGTAPYNILYRFEGQGWAWMKDCGIVYENGEYKSGIWTALKVPSSTTSTYIEIILTDGSIGSVNAGTANIIDRETIPIVRDGINGKNSVRLALDNEHEDFLYDDAGNLIAPSGGATSQARLYDGIDEVSAQSWEISTDGSNWTSQGNYTSGNARAKIGSSGLLTIEQIYVQTAKIKVRAIYNTYPYYAEFTANRTSQDKYDLILKPNAISYNSATYPQAGVSIDASAKRTDLQGKQSTVSINTSQNISAGNLYLFWAYVSSDGSIGTPQNLAGVSKTVSKEEASSYAGIYFELRRYTDNSNYRLCDYETVEIAKSENGANGADGRDGRDGTDGNDGMYYIIHFALSASRTSHPAENSTDWQTNEPTPTTSKPYVWQRSRLWNPNTNNWNTGSSWVYVCLTGEKGINGESGRTGRFYYYAEEYEANKTYKMERTQAPYVKGSDGNFYMLDFGSQDLETGSTTSDPVNNHNGATGSGTQPWTLMASEQQYYIAKAYFGPYANLGSFIINLDWMISQDGNGKYTDFDPLFVEGKTKVAIQKLWVDSNQTIITGLELKQGKEYTLSLNGRALGKGEYLRVNLVYEAEIGDPKTLALYHRKDTDPEDAEKTSVTSTFTPSYSGKYKITANKYGDNTNAGCYISSYKITANFDTYTPNFAVDGKTGETYHNKAHIRGDVTAQGLIAKDDTLTTEISPGVVTFRSVAYPLAYISIGADDDGMFFKMTDKNGRLRWDISDSGAGKITATWGTINLKKITPGSTNPLDVPLSEFSYVAKDNTTEYQVYNGVVYTSKSTDSAKITAGYYVGINNGVFMQDQNTGRYTVVIYQYGSDGKIAETINYEFDM